MCEITDWSSARKGVNWKLMGKVFAAWVLTLVFAAAFSASLFTFISSAYFPRSASQPCGEVAPVLAGIENIHPEYATKDGLKNLFKRIDANGDDVLDEDELKAFGMDETVKGDSSVEKWAKDKKEMTEKDFLKWRCFKKDSMESIGNQKCEPVCNFKDVYGDLKSADGKKITHSKEMKCKLYTEERDGYHFQYTKYSKPACMEDDD